MSSLRKTIPFDLSPARNGVPQKKGGLSGDARRGHKQVLDIPRKSTAGEWLEEQIALSQTKVRTLVLELSVELARAMLARNPDNRTLSIATVEKYARDISSDSWPLNGEPIIISRDGFLNDGQHRCEAVIAAGRSIQVILVIGTERESRLTIDQGKNRMAGDYLGMEGHTDSIALAACAGYLWQYKTHGKISNQQLYRPTKGEVLATVNEHSDLKESLKSIQSKGSDAVGGRAILAFCHFVFTARSGAEAANEFLAGLVGGAGLPIRSPILYVRNRLIENRGRLRPNEKAELIFRGWGAWRRRETPKTLMINDGVLPVVER